MCQRLVCQKVEFAARLSSEVHEIFMRIDMKHSYFSNYIIICFPSSIFFVVKAIIIELFVVCRNIIHVHEIILFLLLYKEILI